MRTMVATILAALLAMPAAQAGTLDPAFIYVTDGKGFGQSPCACWNDSGLGQICVDHNAPNSGFLEGRMVYWALHQTAVTFTTYVGNCGGQTIATVTTPATQ